MHKLIAVGASAGGLEALLEFVAELPDQLPAAMLVVIHMPPHSTSRIPEIVGRATGLSVSQAVDGDELAAGTIRVARPDHHLEVDGARLRVERGPRENRHRPSIDVLFRSVAERNGPGAIAVVLSGAPGDGPAGVQAMADAGAAILVQDPREALFAPLPESVLEVAPAAVVAPSARLAEHVVRLMGDEGDRRAEEREEARKVASAEESMPQDEWRPVPYSCPDCNGVLWERVDGDLIRFRCRVGHRFGADGLLEAKADELETALWSAVNTLQERAELSERMAKRAGGSGAAAAERRFSRTAAEMRGHAASIRDGLLKARPAD